MEPSDVHLIIGALEQHKKHTDHRLNVLEKKMDKLWEWRWRLGGALALVATIVTGAFQIVLAVIRGS